MRALVEFLKTPDGSPRTTRERDLVDFFGGVLTRNLVVNKEFLDSIATTIDSMIKLREHVDDDLTKLKTFHAFERYKTPGLEQMCNGSILKTCLGQYFIVVTPVCDFSHNDNVERILLIEAEPLGKYIHDRKLTSNKLEPYIKNSKSIVHYLPYVPKLPDGLICRFDQITNMSLKKLQEMFEREQVTCFTIINSPFIENLMQRMNAYLMRLGVRDLHEGEIKNLLSKETGDNQKSKQV